MDSKTRALIHTKRKVKSFYLLTYHHFYGLWEIWPSDFSWNILLQECPLDDYLIVVAFFLHEQVDLLRFFFSHYYAVCRSDKNSRFQNRRFSKRFLMEIIPPQVCAINLNSGGFLLQLCKDVVPFSCKRCRSVQWWAVAVEWKSSIGWWEGPGYLLYL